GSFVDGDPDAFLGRQDEVVVTLRTAPQVLLHLGALDGGAALVALLEQAARHAALLGQRLLGVLLVLLTRPPGHEPLLAPRRRSAPSSPGTPESLRACRPRPRAPSRAPCG